MQYRELGKTGLKVSVVGFGGLPIQRVTFEEGSRVVNKALDLGINFFDTARGYTDSEEKLGQALQKRRSEAIIATKSMARTKEDMAADIKLSLQTLGIDYIDLYQLHNVKDKNALEQVFGPGGAVEALLEARQKGLIKHIGITGHIQEILKEALKYDVLESVQFPFNAVEVDDGEELLKLAESKNVGIIIMKPLAGGALTNADLALRFILSYPVSSIIPGMDSEEQVEANANVVEKQPLTKEEENTLAKEKGKLGTTFCRRCEYCQPCPQNINIPTVFLLDGYFTRYNLKHWANERYKTLPVAVEECIDCGECEEKCPYDLPIREMLKEVGSRLG
ncbi:MAG: 4Fe-4S dicluster domain-containing protein [Firmicutes bacterium]|nr:4Fe-4S dicluster domain-containing protein [Bacillota bacterium]